MTTKRWTTAEIPDLHAKRVVVTGANSGLGLATARELARRGAHVILACRSREKTEQAIAELRRELPDVDEEQLEFQALDLASLASIRAFAARLAAAHDELDLLINNAGVMALPYCQTADGFEMQIGTNHLGHFALTGALLPLLLAAPAARVVTVSSLTHQIGKLDLDDLQGKRRYSRWGAYGTSKLANLLFTYELQRRLDATGAGVLSLASHPGYASTNLVHCGPNMRGAKLTSRVMAIGNRVAAQSATMGALPSLYAATATGLVGGEFIGPDGLMQLHGWPRVVESSARSHERGVASALWTRSIELTKVEFLT